MKQTPRVLFVLASCAVAVYFLALTHKALQGYFSTDDSMNLYVSWYPSLASLIKANFVFFLNSPFYRPMGAAWYRVMFFFAGYRPEAFHAVNLVILMINVWLVYELASRLSDSRETGALAALLIAYQPAFTGLYFDTAYIYDVLCFGFFLAALLVYLVVQVVNPPSAGCQPAAGCHPALQRRGCWLQRCFGRMARR